MLTHRAPAGVLDAGHGRAYLLVGSPGSLQCYDVHLNRDVFFKEIAEGVSVLQVGWLGQLPEQIAICGGNCAVQVGCVHAGSHR